MQVVYRRQLTITKPAYRYSPLSLAATYMYATGYHQAVVDVHAMAAYLRIAIKLHVCRWGVAPE